MRHFKKVEKFNFCQFSHILYSKNHVLKKLVEGGAGGGGKVIIRWDFDELIFLFFMCFKYQKVALLLCFDFDF
jgi:hypothetical protein